MANLTAGLLDVLRCPVTGSVLVQDGDELVSTVPDAGGKPVRYRVEEGIPVLLKAAATRQEG
ncbi:MULTISPECIES: Trm112 family protein [Arthrobacter]|uniref:Trm112 family protein n=1 Tax=Arthrobacter jinronghuae TaxID=2964609 RepID=A0ABT1NTX0_9MICC|nr:MULTISPECIES: hypothetical protein [Arthrobacter]MCC9175236.1 hypothetical protein [Arthrobacter sp. zg-Y179]MCQ1951031.1 hypothetical protein [Arthrobacter jinronghuae]MCQ1954344.1 hypothetical protein [Arthrobacter sp. zg-Y238]MCQ1957220.1 hypothetical protein [Arthrobacter jinronghuae]UWX79485.1 hypothetical protein N2K98_04570 [Arthrobacter jinronghuae]